MSLRSINPFTGKMIQESDELSEEAIGKIIAGSESAFTRWKDTDFSRRRSLLSAVADTLIDNIDLYAMSITGEMGKPITESEAEIEKCAWVCRYYADNGEAYLTEESISTDAHLSYVRYEPLGTILGIMPWNFPFWQVFRFAVPALMAGNTVLLKHASNVQVCARHIEDIFSVSGFPKGVFSNLAVGSDRMENIIAHNAIKGVSLTGSELAGEKVAQAAGKNLKKCLLELGGSNAFIVLGDADLEQAAETGARARMMNAGQSCIAAKRFIVDKKVSAGFIRLFKNCLEKYIPGDPSLKSTRMGPLASVRQAETVEKQVNDSVAMGATIIAGGKRDGAFYPPTLVLDVKPGMPLFDEEIFGPVAPVTISENLSEAIALANQTKFGLGVTLFTGDIEGAVNLVGKFKDGAVFVNELVKSDPRLPFGGTGRSGFGRELSVQGIREFVNIKTVYIRKP